jgi:competence protein ComEA
MDRTYLKGEIMEFKLQQGSWKKFQQGLLALALGASLLTMAPAHAVNINSASPEVLQNVKGIGPSRAKAIVDERERNGAYLSAEDLNARIKGIGQKTIEKMSQSGLTFDATETMTRAKSARIK